jgi:hypothetical protein
MENSPAFLSSIFPCSVSLCLCGELFSEHSVQIVFRSNLMMAAGALLPNVFANRFHGIDPKAVRRVARVLA